MQVLIVESNPHLAMVWKRHLERQSIAVTIAHGQTDATNALREIEFRAIVLDLLLEEGSAFAVADFASYRRPDAKIIFVTNTSFFSDGSIFQHIPNVCAFLPSATDPDDLAAVVEHYGSD